MKRKVLIGCAVITLCFGVTGCFKMTTVSITKNNKFEINSSLKVKDLIENKDDLELLNGDEVIDTSKLGEKKVVIKFKTKNGKEKSIDFKVNVVDTKKPEIDANDEITITIGDAVDLTAKATVTDNSSEVLTATIEGDYDTNKAGEYNLKFVATDSSKNKATKDFKLIVKQVSIRKSGYYVYKTSDAWHEVKFDENGKFYYDPWWCPGSGCGGGGNARGTYKIEGNTIIASVTEEWPDDIGDPIYHNPPRTWKFTINSETQVEMEGQKFNWQRTFEG